MAIRKGLWAGLPVLLLVLLAQASHADETVYQKAIRSLKLNIAPTVTPEGHLSVTYEFNRSSVMEKGDWKVLRKPDRFVLASSDNVAEGHDGLDIGVGRRLAKVVYPVHFEGPCSMEIDFYLWFNGLQSAFHLTMCEAKPGRGLAIDWGRYLVRKRGKRVRPKGEPARSLVKAGADYVMRVELDDAGVRSVVHGQPLVSEGLEARERTPGVMGLEVFDARVIIRRIAIEGKISKRWATKQAKRAR